MLNPKDMDYIDNLYNPIIDYEGNANYLGLAFEIDILNEIGLVKTLMQFYHQSKLYVVDIIETIDIYDTDTMQLIQTITDDEPEHLGKILFKDGKIYLHHHTYDIDSFIYVYNQRGILIEDLPLPRNIPVTWSILLDISLFNNEIVGIDGEGVLNIWADNKIRKIDTGISN